MKKKTFIVGLMIAMQTVTPSLSAQVRNELKIPDVDGYQTLKCDFHMHTVFSDGLVWPTVRVDEAYREGLDAIALTEHIEYRPHKTDIVAHHGRSFELAEAAAKKNNIILIRGSEITRSMPPGHFNAIFTTNNDSLDQKEWRDAFKAAKSQHAFIFWNHPGWAVQQPDSTKWWPEHTELLNAGCMQGIEVANSSTYFPEAQRWCMEKKLTMLGNSDVHQPIKSEVDFSKGGHRIMTLVFAKERSAEGIREALLNRRTAVYVNNDVIGEEKYLKPLFENSIEILNVEKSSKSIKIILKNNSDLTFELLKTEHDTNLVYFRHYTIDPNATHEIVIKLQNGIEKGDVNFEVTNLLVAPNQGLRCSYKVSLK
nr:Sb-PDE family phosphodiesterase [uncultured Bacteroides sp.]